MESTIRSSEKSNSPCKLKCCQVTAEPWRIERVHKPLFLLHRGLRAKSSKTPQNMLQNYGAKGMVQKYTPFLVFAP